MPHQFHHKRLVSGFSNRENEADSWDAVNQFIATLSSANDYMKITKEELNQLSSQFPTSVQPPKESTKSNTYGVPNLYQKETRDANHHLLVADELTSLMTLGGFLNSNSYVDMGYTEAFDRRTLPPGSILQSITRSSVENIYQQQSQLNSWKPEQTQPHVAEEFTSQNCNDLDICKERRKRKFDLLETPNNISWSGTGSLMEVVTSCLNSNTGDRFSQESFASRIQQCLLVNLPPLEQLPDDGVHGEVKTKPSTRGRVSHLNSIITENSVGNHRGSYGNSYTTNDEFKEPPKLSFEEKASNGMKKSSEVGPKVLCGFNSASDGYESPMQFITRSILGSAITNTQITASDENVSAAAIKKLSASLADSFTASQIKEHLSSFIQHNEEISRNTTLKVGQNRCQLCFKDKLLLAPAPIYCSSCDSRIKQNVGYYWSTDEENTNTQHRFCKSCFKGSRGSTISIRGVSISKAKLHKAVHDDESEDSWVECDRCLNLQHRICGLYNNEIDDEEKAEYVCPICCLKGIENGTRIPSPKTVMEAKDLPRTNLSDHIERRLFRLMKQEREETAKLNGIEFEEVPEAEGLVVRVVVSVDKELEVKQHFRDIFDGQDYPEKIAYKSKLILLFQRRRCVDLCLFGMYVQEFGSECDGPNKRCVYISYIDSVKYFQPERNTHNGESLRTFVYHEILIGYLEHCKKRGFATCYIWACPLQEGDDYIFYCHPETQKTPKQDKLRQWYKLMIRKAAEDGIVVESTNLYNQFFNPTKRGHIKISAANLPYFDGDYWSNAAEIISKKLQEEVEERLGESGSKSSSPTKRILIPDSTRDALVMQKLGECILRSKENFIIIRLQHMCTSCHEIILSGSIWICSRCNKIQLCSRCFDAGKFHSESKTHSCHSGKSTQLSEQVLKDIPLDTKDEDDVIVNKFCETRDGFLNKCQTSQYPFNTLVYAKYSSMMILYHFTHNLVIQPKADTSSIYNLTRPSVKATSETETEQPQKQNMSKIQRALDVLTHVIRCEGIQCSDRDCRIIKKLVDHAYKCSVRARNGCIPCQRVWAILRKHKQICTDSGCRIPCCMDIRRTSVPFNPASSENKQDALR